MEIVLGWIILAVLVGIFAGRRGRSGVLAFLVSIILSPLIGFILYAVIGESKRSMTKRIYEEEKIRAEARKKIND